MQPLHPDDPRQVGRYVLEGRLGAGGMGTVYLGRSPSRRRVAVKVVHRHLLDHDPTFRERFRREVEAAKAVGGFWTPGIAGADPDADPPWYASDYVDAPDLHNVVQKGGPLDLRRAVALGIGLAEALGDIHGAGVIHRDFKPSNVLVAADGPRVIDFGIARAVQGGRPLTASGVRLLSLGYAPPEQMLGQRVTTASDVFALGALMVFATTGHLPYPGDTEVAVARRMDHAPDLRGVPDQLRPVLQRCLATDPANRPTVRRLLAWFTDLDRQGGRRTVRDDSAGNGDRRASPAPFGRVALAAVLVSVLLAAQLHWWLGWPLGIEWLPLRALITLVLVGFLIYWNLWFLLISSPGLDDDVGIGVLCVPTAICGIGVVAFCAQRTGLPKWADLLIGFGVFVVLLSAASVAAMALQERWGRPAYTTTAMAVAEAGLFGGLLVWLVGVPVWLAVGLALPTGAMLAVALTRLMPVVPRLSGSVAAPGT